MILKDWLKEKPFTLALSSGYFSFFAHAGILSALEEENILPRKITGSSAGALAGGCWAAGISASELRDILFGLHRKDFWDPGFGLGLLKGNKFQEKLAEVLPAKSFSECKTKLVLSAYDLNSRKTITLEKGDLAAAIYASCALPFMFQPIKINNYRLLDGGIKDRPALASIAEGERVFYHHIASKSPWRRAKSPALQLPKKNNLTSLIIYDLPRCGPTKLEVGKEAFDKARKATKRALLMGILENSVGLSA